MTKDVRQVVAQIKALLRRPVSYESVLKYNRNQPRGPKGSHTGGQWIKGVSAGVTLDTVGFKESTGVRDMAERMRGMGNANYADIMAAPTGTGFFNRPRITGSPEAVAALTTPPAPVVPPKSKTAEVLQTGTVTGSRPLGNENNANVSLVVTLEDGTKAVFKPEVGETWVAPFGNMDILKYVTNREFSLAEREAIAHEISEELGVGLVPLTIHRKVLEGVDLPDPSEMEDDDDGGYDEDLARELYDAYREQAQEDAMGEVGEELGNLYDAAQEEHLENVKGRVEEVEEIWNELVEQEFPDLETERAAVERGRAHPALPMGSKDPFARRVRETVDPLAVLKEGRVNMESDLTDLERENVKVMLREHLEKGAQELGDLDEDAAREDLDRDQWMDEHRDTEDRLYRSKIQDFTTWRHQHGYATGGGGGGGRGNKQAPHPQGGSLQEFVPGLDDWGSVSPEEGAKLAVFDYIQGTMDRHGSNLPFSNGKPVAIDNGYSMPGSDTPDGFTFRSKAVYEWRDAYSSRNVPESIRAPILARLKDSARWQALLDRHPDMNPKEKAAFLGRIEKMKTALETGGGLMTLWRGQKLEY